MNSNTSPLRDESQLTDLYNHVYDLIQLRPDDNPSWRKDLCEILGKLHDIRVEAEVRSLRSQPCNCNRDDKP